MFPFQPLRQSNYTIGRLVYSPHRLEVLRLLRQSGLALEQIKCDSCNSIVKLPDCSTEKWTTEPTTLCPCRKTYTWRAGSVFEICKKIDFQVLLALLGDFAREHSESVAAQGMEVFDNPRILPPSCEQTNQSNTHVRLVSARTISKFFDTLRKEYLMPHVIKHRQPLGGACTARINKSAFVLPIDASTAPGPETATTAWNVCAVDTGWCCVFCVHAVDAHAPPTSFKKRKTKQFFFK